MTTMGTLNAGACCSLVKLLLESIPSARDAKEDSRRVGCRCALAGGVMENATDASVRTDTAADTARGECCNGCIFFSLLGGGAPAARVMEPKLGLRDQGLVYPSSSLPTSVMQPICLGCGGQERHLVRRRSG